MEQEVSIMHYNIQMCKLKYILQIADFAYSSCACWQLGASAIAGLRASAYVSRCWSQHSERTGNIVTRAVEPTGTYV